MASNQILTNGKPKQFDTGKWAFEMVSASSGTATFLWLLPGRTLFVPIDDAFFEATRTPILQLPDCKLKVDMTGDISEVAYERVLAV